MTQELPMIPRAVTPISSPITGVVILSVVILLLILFSVQKKQYLLYLKGLTNNHSRQMLYDNETPNIWANIMLAVVSLAGLSLLAIALLQYHVGVLVLSWHYILIFPAIALVLLLKWLIIKFIGYTFNVRDKSSDFISAYITITAVAGVLSIFFAIGLIYATGTAATFVFVGVVAFILIYKAFVLFKMLRFFYAGKGSVLYIFLYLCTFEIMPVFVMLKLVSSKLWIV